MSSTLTLNRWSRSPGIRERTACKSFNFFRPSREILTRVLTQRGNRPREMLREVMMPTDAAMEFGLAFLRLALVGGIQTLLPSRKNQDGPSGNFVYCIMFRGKFIRGVRGSGDFQ